MGQDGQKTGDLDNAARLPVKITVRIVEDADLLQLFEAFANQSGTAGVIGPFEALHKGLSTDTLVFFVLTGVDQNNQEFSKLRFKVGILDQQRQLA